MSPRAFPRLSRSTAVRRCSPGTVGTGLAFAALIGGTLLSGAATGAPAAASVPYPAAPSGTKVASTSHSGFTVSLNRSAYASVYRVYTSTLKADLYQSAIARPSSRRTTAASTSPRITLSDLSYTTSPYYYRVRVINGSHSRWSAVSTAGAHLAPSAPTGLSVVAGSQGAPFLHWTSGAATGYQIRQSTTSDFSSDVTGYSSRGPDVRFTPSSTAAGHTYYFQVRALNSGAVSGFSNLASTTVQTGRDGLRILTYNVRNAGLPHDEAPWSQRLPAAVGLIKSVSPDILGLQEAAARVRGDSRQVDTVAASMPGYKVADTYTLADGSVQRSYGNYLVYRASSLTPIRKGGQWRIGNGTSAAYTAFRTGDGATFLAVSVHLTSGAGPSRDDARKYETGNVMKYANAYAHDVGVTSVVYVGDFNSYYGRYHTTDTPGNIMRALHMSDAKLAAQHEYNAKFSSINNYQRVAPTGYGASDHVYSSPGVGVYSWGELLHVSHGRFVGVIPSDHNAVWAELMLPVAGG